jgi:hypothetical protein
MNNTNGFEPTFDIDAVHAEIDQFVDEKLTQEIALLAHVGEEFCNHAKDEGVGNYTDQSANLRNSIGFIIVSNGESVFEFIESNEPEGESEFRKHAEELKNAYSGESKDSAMLICIAGMEYAAAVESYEGYNVLSNSVPKAEKLLKRVIKEL